MSGRLPDPEEDFEIEVDDGEDFEIEVDDGEDFDFEASLDFDLPDGPTIETQAADIVDVIERGVAGSGFTAEAPSEDLWDPGTPNEARTLWGKGWDIHAALAAANAVRVDAPLVSEELLDPPHFDELSAPLPPSATTTVTPLDSFAGPDALDEPTLPTASPPRAATPIWVIGAAAAAAMVLMLIALGALSAVFIRGSAEPTAVEPVLTLPEAPPAPAPIVAEPVLELQPEAEPTPEAPPEVAPSPKAAAAPSPRPTTVAQPKPAPRAEPAPTETKKKKLFGRKKRKK
ncbi:MAG: hypothetical protein KC912_25560 [Proteobacteria bacterium]|nr:hypothetical protein [Pseudomonadota bacterium]